MENQTPQIPEIKFRLVRYEGGRRGEYFVKYDRTTDSPIFTKDAREAREFVFDSTNRRKDSITGNLIALYDMFNIKCIPEEIK